MDNKQKSPASPANDYSESDKKIQQILQTKIKAKKQNKHDTENNQKHKQNKQKHMRKGSPISETAYKSLKSNNETKLNVNRDCDGSMRVMEKKQLLTPLAIRKLRSDRPRKKPRTTVTLAGRKSPVLNLAGRKSPLLNVAGRNSPVLNLDWLKLPTPISPIKDSFIDLLPISEDPMLSLKFKHTKDTTD